MNIISNTKSVRLFLVIPMAEGVACVDGNGSFDNQTDEAAPTEYVDLQDELARLLYRHGQSLKSDRKSVSTPSHQLTRLLKRSDFGIFQVRTWNFPECFNNRFGCFPWAANTCEL